MAKQSVTYIGDEPEITVYGETFEKGKVVQFDDKDPNFEKLSNNPTFEVGSDAKSAAADARKELKAEESDEA